MLVFTNDQIKNITKDIILIPFIIDDPENNTGYVQQKEGVQVLKDSIAQTDGELKVFSDLHINNITNYHKAYEALTTEKRSNYSEAMLQEGGLQQAPHFETSPIWMGLIPKLRSENTGLPISDPNTHTEIDLINLVTPPIGALKNGFSYGTYTGIASAITGLSFTVEEEIGISVGDEGMLTSGNAFSYIRITSITPAQAEQVGPPAVSASDALLEYIVLGGTTGPMATGNFRNYQSGFTNAQRGRQVAISGSDLAIMQMFEQAIINSVNDWKANMVIQRNAFAQTDDGARRTQVNNAITELDNTLLAIDLWELAPLVDPNGRFTDTGLDALELSMSDRKIISAELITIMETEIFGTLTQVPKGDFTGEGSYFDLFTFVNLRISKGTGTLFQFYQADMAISLFDKKILDANSQLTQYKNTFALVKVLSDTELGQIEFDCETPNEFSEGDSVYVMDNATIVFTRNIIDIDGNTITLDNGIPAELKLNGLGRITRQK